MDDSQTTGIIRTKIAITGYTLAEFIQGLPYLQEEFSQRPWLLKTDAMWEVINERLLITIERAGSDPVYVGKATFDEVWDCVQATLDFSSEHIHFDIIESTLLSQNAAD